MKDGFRRSWSLRALCGACAILLIPCLIVWLVNLEMAIRALRPDWIFVGRFMPDRLFASLVPLCADLSTVTTLVPVLLLAFPLLHGLRILRHVRDQHLFIDDWPGVPYPPRFAFFLVMLGLTGTLYGLLIGLSVSEVGQVTGGLPTAETVSASLERLLGGTATALLSSLAGLVGAFLAAHPFSWAFRRLAGLEERAEEKTLTEAVEELTGDLQGLGRASRQLVSDLQSLETGGLIERVESLTEAVREIGKRMEASNQSLANIEAGQKEANHHMSRVASIEKTAQTTQDAVTGAADAAREMVDLQRDTSRVLQELKEGIGLGREAVEKLSASNQSVEAVRDLQARAVEILREWQKSTSAFQESQLEELRQVLEALQESGRKLEGDRRAVRKAFAVYARGERGTESPTAEDAS